MLAKLQRYVNGINLQNKLIVLFLLLSVIPLALLGTFSYYKSSNVIQEKVYQTVLENLSQVNFSLNYFVRDIEQLSMYIYGSSDIQEVLAKDPNRSLVEKYEDEKKMNRILESFLGFKNWDIEIYLLGLNGDRYFTGDLLPNPYAEFNPNWGLFRKARLAEGNVVWDTHYAMKKIDDFGVVLSSGRLIKKIDTNQPLGYLVIDIMEPALADKYNKAHLYPGGQVFLLDRNGYTISSIPSKQQVGTKLNESFLPKVLEGKKGFFNVKEPSGDSSMIIYDTSEATGFKLISKVPVAAVTKDSLSIRNLTVAVIVLEVIVFFGIAYLISRTLTQPLRKLRSLMRQVESGNMNVMFPSRYDDEIGQLGQSFNNMLQQIKLLINEVYEKQLMVQQAELKAVQAQFNPHFLYNTLDSINWMARIYKVDDISRTAISLGELLRFSIRKDGPFIPLGEDMRQIRNYLVIQQIRYRDKYEVTFDLDPSLESLYTLKLLLQPIIENAITHGLEMKVGKGKLDIHVAKIGDRIRFVVRDDGIGMYPGTAERIMSGGYASDHPEKTGIGLENVRKRLLLYFGRNYRLSIDSAPQQGTTVQIEIPVLNSAEEGEHVSNRHSG
ncbi:sensor histidine kinase [Paenibacillus sp. MSJ-34]|uniref:sensor histidine kinase n=1 Tax=Paenibacillus sp. MSJ-34 TaxID=2841529 RepID=UPI001C124C9E|nr:sensor histidine kinase [Paenibacillus sp. MSJ-34]MBU5442813.1 sensor histidine kinase [Paenibacillus sp. MSJ-34]